MRIQQTLIHRLLVATHRRLGHRVMLELLQRLSSDETNNFRISEEFSLSLHLVRVLRLRPEYCLAWLLQRLSLNDLGGASLQELQKQHRSLTDRQIFPN